MTDASGAMSAGAPREGDVAPRTDTDVALHLPLRTVIAMLVRCLAIQGSWNYRTMIGGGFAFALLPALRHIVRGDGRRLEEAVTRHCEHFNAHPYLAALAVGATARLEAEGVDPDMVRRFKLAIRGPLGGLGDNLVWAGWLPLTLLVALVAGWAGAPPWTSVLLFLALYNLGHLGLRTWALTTGLERGKEVGTRLREVNLGHQAERLVRMASAFLGALAGLLLAGTLGMGLQKGLWGVLAACAFLVGLLGGHYTWRPAALGVVGAIVGMILFGLIG